MAEESTPLPDTGAEDTSAVLENADTSQSEPAKTAEPEAQNGEAETEASGGTSAADGQETGANGEDTAEKLIFGKYKSLEDAEKGYKEAEKAITRSAELEKRLKAYQEREEQESRARQDAARKLGFNDAEEQRLDWEVKNFEFARCVEALGATLEGEKYTEAYNALARYRATLNPRELAAAKACCTGNDCRNCGAGCLVPQSGGRRVPKPRTDAASGGGQDESGGFCQGNRRLA